MIEVNYETLVFDLEQKSYGTSETSKKALGYVNFMLEPRFLFYLHFMQDLVSVIKSVSLKFQEDKLLACEVPRVIDEVKLKIESLLVTPHDSFTRLMNEVGPDPINPTAGILMFKSIILTKPDGRRHDGIDHTASGYEKYYTENAFGTIVSGTQRYFTKRFEDFEKTPMKEMVTIFDFKSWPKAFSGINRKWGLEEVTTMANCYADHKFITKDEALLAPRHWLVFRQRVSKFRNEKSISVYTDIMQENDDEVRGMLILLQIMMAVSSSTAACERGFSCMNRQKTNLRTCLSHQSLDDIMRIGIDGACSIEEFEPKKHVESWMSSGKRHLDGHAKPTSKKQKM